MKDVRRELTTPQSAAVAGILFALTFGFSMTLLGLAFPEGMASSPGADLVRQQEVVRLALNLIPYSGIAFLWFIGVVRDLMGKLEDQFFSTVYLGSGLVFIGLMFVAAALAAGVLVGELRELEGQNMYASVEFGRIVMEQITQNYALRMAGVFMLSLGTIWYRTGVMPRWLALLTLLMALSELLVVSTLLPVSLLLPTWVLIISIFILVRNRRNKRQDAETARSADNP